MHLKNYIKTKLIHYLMVLMYMKSYKFWIKWEQKNLGKILNNEITRLLNDDTDIPGKSWQLFKHVNNQQNIISIQFGP